MRVYSFVSTWRFRAPIEQVWAPIRDYQSWPSWWPEIARARLVMPGDADGVGETIDFVFRTRLGYALRFRSTVTHVLAPRELDGRVTGELEGTGRWRFVSEGEGARVEVLWDVATTNRWMNLLGPIAAPAFRWNHAQVMASGERSLGRLLANRAAQSP